MEHLNLAQFLGLLFVTFTVAKLAGHCAQALGQPSVLGELLAGVIVGKSMLGLVDPSNETVHLMGELGVVILLFSIGLETDLGSLLRVGGTSLVVALAGVALPFALGFGVTRGLGVGVPTAIVCGAALTATSVGITARVLSDLGRLQDSEGQVVLGAAILDDVIGLVILAVVAELTGGGAVTLAGVAKTTAVAFGFLVVVVVVGQRIVPRLLDFLGRVGNTGTPALAALALAFGLGWLADRVGSAVIVGAFAAGLLVVGSSRFHDVEAGVTRLGHFFVPLFFVSVGAAVDVSRLESTQRGEPSDVGGGRHVDGRRGDRQVRGGLRAVLVSRPEKPHRRGDDSTRRGGPHLRPDGTLRRLARRRPVRRAHHRRPDHNLRRAALAALICAAG